MTDYEQITSLLSDGRGHKGVDFKAPVGTPIVSPFAGQVVRRNWAVRRNGYSVDIKDSKTGLHALFLHLDRVDPAMKPGARVRPGQLIGTCGNTGHSTAPHLHYQIQRGPRGRVVDPFKVHKTFHRSVPEEDRAELAATFRRFASMRTSVKP